MQAGGKLAHDQAMATKTEVDHALERVIMMLPGKIDHDELVALIERAEALKPPFEPAPHLVPQAKEKLKEVEKIFAARRKKATLEALAKFDDTPPLELDTDAVAACLKDAVEVGVEEAKLAPMREKLTSAEAEQAAVLASRHLDLLAKVGAPTTVDAAALQAALDVASTTRRMPDEALARARSRLEAAAAIEAAREKLAGVAQQSLDPSELSHARAAALRAGVPLAAVDGACAEALASAEEAARGREAARARLEWRTLCALDACDGESAALGDAAAALRAARADAATELVDDATLARADVALARATATAEQRDRATAGSCAA